MKNIYHKTIAIIGGGPGGLTLARLLQMSGADVKVYERDQNEHARAKGATLDLHEESGLKALQAAGLMDAFKANYRPGADKVRVMDKHAAILYDDELSGNTETSRPEIDRGPLQKILMDSLLPGAILWDKQFVSLTSQNNAFKLDFKDGSCAFADIVIAADGANSKLRPYITPIKPFFAGVTAVEGSVADAARSVPYIAKLLNGGKIFAFGDEQTLIVSSKGDGSLQFYTGCNTTQHWVAQSGIDFKDKAQVLCWFKQTFTEWDDVWLELFENSDYFIPRPQYCMPLDQSWQSQPNITMLGDAAHLMPPYAGEGVNMAMLDALELSECLLSDDFEDTGAAIAAYEKQMLIRAAETAEMTLHSTRVLHSVDGLEFMLGFMNY